VVGREYFLGQRPLDDGFIHAGLTLQARHIARRGRLAWNLRAWPLKIGDLEDRAGELRGSPEIACSRESAMCPWSQSLNRSPLRRF
jgi:hypothetical protein